jgi:FkbH-like protein
MSTLQALAPEDLLVKRKGLRRRLSGAPHLLPIRIAILGGSTTQEVADLLELYLLESGFVPTFHQSDYGRYESDALHSPEALIAFAPELVYLHTSVRNIESFPPLASTQSDVTDHVSVELLRFQRIWRALTERLNCPILQNNFELPQHAPLGNLDAQLPGGHTHFVLALNRAFSEAKPSHAGLLIHDIASLSARIGLDRWFDPQRWFRAKIHTTPTASNALAQSLAAIIRSLYGRSRKVLILDLDNTLWGGVIGDDGPDRIVLGQETPLAEAFTAFQLYCLALRDRGILLAVCSKNDDTIARQGFEHPDSILKLEHFSAFKANWEPKSENIAAIARELNLGIDSFVFADDNPAERALIAAQLPTVAVPDLGSDPADYPRILESGRYFEPIALSQEDLARATLYQQNAHRTATAATFADYGQYLGSLAMTAEIAPFKAPYLDRITQLTNKTNQFNLTTRRYTLPEIEAAATDPNTIALYARLTDRFGDNGLVSVILARRQGTDLAIDLWLMSCRVLKRDLEVAMLDALVAHARGVTRLIGTYIPTPKNAMVANHYPSLGFSPIAENTYALDITRYTPRNTHIRTVLPDGPATRGAVTAPAAEPS